MKPCGLESMRAESTVVPVGETPSAAEPIPNPVFPLTETWGYCRPGLAGLRCVDGGSPDVASARRGQDGDEPAVNED